MTSNRAVIFDCDGLLLDTERLWMEAEIELLSDYGIEYTPDIRERLFGTGAKNLVPILEDILDKPGEGENLVRELLDRAWVKVANGSTPLPGAHDLLKTLSETDGFRIAVASNSPRKLVDEALQNAGLRDFVESVTGGDEVETPKPAPDVYLLACERLGISPEGNIALEDSPTGVAAAKAAGLYVIGVPSEPGPPLPAHEVVESLADKRVLEAIMEPSTRVTRNSPHTTSPCYPDLESLPRTAHE